MEEQQLAQMVQLLQGLMQPDTDVVRNAGQELNKVLKQSASMPILFHLMQSSPHAEIRQLAAVLLRKKIVGHWGKFNQDTQNAFKSGLLKILVEDSSNVVRRAAAGVIGVIARLLIPNGQWNELLQFLFECTKSNDVEHRAIALGVFDTLTEHVADSLRAHFNVLHKIFMDGMQDKETKVRVAALKAVGSLAQMLTKDEEVAKFMELVPLMVNIIKYCAVNGLEDEVLSAFEVLDEFTEQPISGTQYVPDLAKFALEVGANKSVSLPIREKALTLVDTILHFKPKVLLKNKLVPTLVQAIFLICAESDPEDLEDDELSPHKMGAQLMDRLARSLPGKHVFPPALEYITQLCSSQNKDHRRAGVIALAVLAEGCPDQMCAELAKILQFVVAAFKDSETEVREAGCLAIGAFAKYLTPDIFSHYKDILPLLFQALDDATDEVKEKSCGALEAFCEELGSEILPYLDPLLAKLLHLLQNSNDRETQETALSAISSTANAAGSAFLPYYDTFVPLLRQMLTLTDETDLLLRCKATECLGCIGTAVGKEKFQPIFKETMTTVLQGCTLDSCELREYSFGFFCNMAEMLKEEFSEWLYVVVPIVLAACDSAEGITGFVEGAVEGLEADEDAEEEVNLHVRTPFLDEKTTACHTLGVLAEQTKAAFLPTLPRVMKSFSNLFSYFHDDVRKAVMISLKQFAMAINATYPKQWYPGVPASQQPLDPNTKEYLDLVMPVLINTIEKDDSPIVVMAACDSVGSLAKLLGPAAVEPVLPSLMNVLLAVLRKAVACQTLHESSADDEEDVELEIETIGEATLAITELVKVLGPLYEPYFKSVTAELVKYCNNKTIATYRSLGIGLIADSVNAIAGAIAPYVQELLPIAFALMKDSDPETRSNATFCCGVLLQHGAGNATQFYGQALTTLAPLFGDQSGVLNIIDNACGAVARMILTSPTHVPLDQVLPVLLNALPLKKDFEENPTVYSCLFHLIKASNQQILGLLPQVVSVFARALGSGNIEAGIQSEMVNILKTLQTNGQLMQIVQTLPPAEQQQLQKALS